MSALASPASAAQEPRLAVWEFAGLMVTYWCNAKCAFCYVYSAPDRGGDLAVADAVRLWAGLDRLAQRHGRRMRVHLAGGEPFGDWPRLLSIVRAARDAGLTPLEKIETNAFWATDDDLTRARLEQLDALGMEHLVISADVYHQEFIPHERVARLIRVAAQVLGGERVVVRRSYFGHYASDAGRRSAFEKAALFERAIHRYQDRLTGRAAEQLAGFFQRFPAAHFCEQRCTKEILQSEHVHIDPYGNVFPGVCAGILFGNAQQTPIDELWDDLAHNWRKNPVLDAVVVGGSYELSRRVTELGYRELPDGYANKCHLCSHVRQFLVERGGWEKWLGPAECYANATDKREAAAWSETVGLSVQGRKLPCYRADRAER